MQDMSSAIISGDVEPSLSRGPPRNGKGCGKLHESFGMPRLCFHRHGDLIADPEFCPLFCILGDILLKASVLPAEDLR
jgi:hypothetical protein